MIYNQNLDISSLVELLEKANDFLLSDLCEYIGDGSLVTDLGNTLTKVLSFFEFNSSLYSRLDTIKSINYFYAF